MKYYVIRIKYLLDGTEKKSEIMSYDTITRAVAKFHSNMGTDMLDESLKGVLCMVVNSEGGILENKKWNAEIIDND